MNLVCVKDLLGAAERARFQPGELARQLGMSLRYLEQQFHELLGQTPYEWLEPRRFEHARALLRGGRLNVSEIAHAVGFEHPSAFGRVFKARYDCSPITYRHRYQRQLLRQWLLLNKPEGQLENQAK